MRRVPLTQLATWLGVPAPQGSERVKVQGICFDSRQAQPGNLFVAVVGERTDGHLYLEQAKERGAVAALVARPCPGSLPQLVVPDTVEALQRLAACLRQQAQFSVAAVTGSVGKTTTKSMLAHLLRQRWSVGETRLSRNSQVGLPTELFNLAQEVEWFVAEAGMSRAGELTRLGRMLQPQLLLYTRVAPVHLEFFPSLSAIAEAKAELIPFLQDDGLLVVNAADPWQSAFPQRFSGRVRRYGLPQGSDLWISRCQSRGLLGSQLELRGEQGCFELFLPLAGHHQAENFLAAACAALGLGVSPEEVVRTAAGLFPQPHRGEVLRLPQGAVVVDDSYNASPVAVAVMLELLAQTPGAKLAVLGEMLELGEEAPRFHREVGEKARACCHALVTVGGENARLMAEAFGPQAFWVPTAEEAVTACRPLLQPEQVVLVKGSRGIGLDRLVAALCGGGG